MWRVTGRRIGAAVRTRARLAAARAGAQARPRPAARAARATRVHVRPLSTAPTTEVRAAHALDVDALQRYLAAQRLPALRGGAAGIEQFSHGQSNPTYLLHADDGSRLVLRKQPPGKLLRGAHAVDREATAMSALAATAVPVPRVRVFCDDAAVLGTPFFIYDFVEGRHFSDVLLRATPRDERRQIYGAFAASLAALHAVDYAAAGLQGFGKPGAFLSRQIKVWASQSAASDVPGNPCPAMPKLIDWLPSRVPTDGAGALASVVHGDFRLDNLIFEAGRPAVAAVLDWELSTLGHPVADLAYACGPYYLPALRGFPLTGFGDTDLAAEGIPTEAEFVADYLAALPPEVAARYEVDARGMPRHYDFFVAFSFFRMAAILQGVYARAVAGSASAPNALKVGALAPTLADLAWAAAQRYEASGQHASTPAAAAAAAPSGARSFSSTASPASTSASTTAGAGAGLRTRGVRAAAPAAAAAGRFGAARAMSTWPDAGFDGAAPTMGHAAPREYRVDSAFEHLMSDRAMDLLQRVHAFLRDEIAPVEAEILKHTYTSSDKWTTHHPAHVELQAKARAAGLTNLFMNAHADPDRRVGQGLTNLEYAPMCELMGRSLVAPVVFNCQAPDTGNMEVLRIYGNDAQQERWLVPLARGEIRSSFTMTEPGVASSDATNMAATVTVDGDDVVLNGRKWWTSGAMDPDCKVTIFMGRSVAAERADAPRHARHTMVLVPMDAPGITIHRPLSVFGFDDAPHGHAEITFDNVRVHAEDAVLLGDGRGFEIAQGRLGPGRIHHCMRLIGMAERAIALMSERADARAAFGGPLSRQGGVLGDVADARIAVDSARLLVLKAAHMMDTVGNKEARAEIAMIKVATPRTVEGILDRAIQTHGALGVSAADSPLPHLWAWARALRLADGPDEVHAAALGKLELSRQRRARG